MNGKTLAELDVKPGDVVRCVVASMHTEAGKEYTINKDGDIHRYPRGSTNESLFSLVSRAADQTQDKLAEAIAPYIRTGVRDRDGREICVGDRIRIRLEGEYTKREYWHPEYEVIFKAPHYTLKHTGGGKDSDTAAFYWRVPQPSSTAKIETISVATTAPAPEAASDAAQRVRHVKRGSTYRVLGRGQVQTDTPLTDYAEVVIYQCETDGRIWVRPISEFDDGRFAALAAMEARHG